jgi:hypothetical protein
MGDQHHLAEANIGLTRGRHGYRVCAVSPFWIWMQVAIVIAVLAGAIIAITKLA